MKIIVDETTTLGNLYKGTELEYLRDILYYDWIKNNPSMSDAVINDMAKGLWINDTIIECLNKIYDLNEQGKFGVYYLNPNKPKICLMHLKKEEVTKTAIIMAGGGYSSVATAVEALPLAMYLYEKKGMNVFMLNYSIYPGVLHMSMLDDLADGVKYIIDHSKELNVVIDDYMVVGFSAGGHLAASWGTDNHGYRHYGLPKPGIIGLGYPVITFDCATHGGTRISCIGSNPTKEEVDEYSCEKHVDKEYPKTYIWACDHDDTVPFEPNSKNFAKVLEEKGIPHILKAYPGTAHGWGLGTGRPNEGWADEMYEFWKK